jgi:hypothetical protein
MPAPSKTNLLTLDFYQNGQPFCNVLAGGAGPNSTDFYQNAQPFYAAGSTAPPILVSVSENIGFEALDSVISSYNSQIVENLVLLDDPFPRGWYKINGTQAATWVEVDNTDANTWTSINDGQSVVWTKVDNSYP